MLVRYAVISDLLYCEEYWLLWLSRRNVRYGTPLTRPKVHDFDRG